ncbi:MAG: hypothetical protein LBL65_05575 [Campylobacteraceae bacterium]|jgi:septal ring factor EnvC (AmiA/AmiB activator)|nr:hypothetical protein [Campylobacteraceae bacterium]
MNLISKILSAALVLSLVGWALTSWSMTSKINALENLNKSLEIKLELKQKESAGYEAALSLQSAQIKQFELDLDSAKKTLQATNKEIDRKYKNIKLAADTCESKLEAIKEVVEVFYAESD